MMFKKIQKNNSGQLRHTLNKFTEGLKVLLLPLLDFIDKAKVGICKVLIDMEIEEILREQERKWEEIEEDEDKI